MVKLLVTCITEEGKIISTINVKTLITVHILLKSQQWGNPYVISYLQHQLKILMVIYTINLTGYLSEIVSVKASISFWTTELSPTIHTAGDESTGEAVCIS